MKMKKENVGALVPNTIASNKCQPPEATHLQMFVISVLQRNATDHSLLCLVFMHITTVHICKTILTLLLVLGPF